MLKNSGAAIRINSPEASGSVLGWPARSRPIRPILLMDEPFGALDPLTRAEMQDMVRELMRRLRKTVLLVTHDLDEALYLASRIVLVEEGRIVANLPSEEFLSADIPEVQAYARAVHRTPQTDEASR